ncbi:hypothetical protein DZF91_11925 [Actinomadura logoneensis]|uniref:GH26 domain-containing protein n=1 Tax=Actinomadura logoneensis TaxID=2293572 RepID=A0A372JN04_9ACTN|nr:hypothetical protein [Actinomadura logoneensis]RFU41411.1 hypothetical protein DZF91_11925 [Actinomadura logoneensis]
MRTHHFAAVAAVAALAGGVFGYLVHPSEGSAAPAVPAAAPRHTSGTLHVALNMPASDRERAAALGFDLFDVDPDEVGALPKDGRALVWVGNTTCGGFEMSADAFGSTVRRLARDPRVYGWYLSDEPNPAECPGIVGRIRERADLIHRYAPGQKAFASLTDWTMTPLKPSATHLDLIGLDPYPCRSDASGCDPKAIATMVAQADRAGFARAMMVPVIQTFGQACSAGEKNWKLPTAPQLTNLLRQWDALLPHPAFDISYSWGHQSDWACPTLADSPGLQQVMKLHNTRPARRTPAPTGTPDPTATPPEPTATAPPPTPSPSCVATPDGHDGT